MQHIRCRVKILERYAAKRTCVGACEAGFSGLAGASDGHTCGLVASLGSGREGLGSGDVDTFPVLDVAGNTELGSKDGSCMHSHVSSDCYQTRWMPVYLWCTVLWACEEVKHALFLACTTWP